MKVFISYHRTNTKYRRKTENILNQYDLEYYAVPEDTDFNGKSQQYIEDYILRNMEDCDVLLCLIGEGTYTRPHVDREIHCALKGTCNTRKGIVAVYLPKLQDLPKDEKKKIAPVKIQQNKKYVVWSNWRDLNENINELLEDAFANSKNKKLQTNHSNPCMQLRSGKYYDVN